MAAPPPWEGWDEPPSCPPRGEKQSAWRPLPLGKVGMSPLVSPQGGENNPHGGPSPLGGAGGGLLPFFVRMCQIIRSQWGGGHFDEAFGILG